MKWGRPVRLSSPGNGAESPRVAVNEQGDAVALWATGDFVQAAMRRSPGDVWRPLHSPFFVFQFGFEPEVAIDAHGKAVAVWVHGSVIQATVGPTRRHLWSTPVTISAADMTAESPQVAVDANGDAVAVWAGRKGASGNPVVEAAVRPAKKGVWRAPVVLATAAESPRIAVNARGDMIVVWETYTGPETPSLIQTVTGSATRGKWRIPVTVGHGGRFGGARPLVGINARGNAVLVWEQRHDNAGTDIQASSRPAARRSWLAPVDIGSVVGQAADAQLAVNAGGRAVVVWDSSTATEVSVEAAAGSVARRAWAAPANLERFSRHESVPTCGVLGRVCPLLKARPLPAPRPEIAIDARGDAVAMWEQAKSFGDGIVRIAYRPAGSSAWQTPVSIAAKSASTPEVAMDARGEAIAVWQGPVVEADILRPAVRSPRSAPRRPPRSPGPSRRR